jgi:glutamyl-tRNA synthetase
MGFSFKDNAFCKKYFAAMTDNIALLHDRKMQQENRINTDMWKIPNYLLATLKGQEGKVVTRFPPEPSGYLHIGHIKAACINYVLAKKFGGKMIMRFDDTNPLKESTEFEIGIGDDLKLIGIVPDKITHTSDYFDVIITYAEQLLRDGHAYVDDSEKDDIAITRRQKVESPNRNNSVETNMTKWNMMKSGTLTTGCVRIKIDMNHSNAACRDPAIFRFLDEEHHNTSSKYKVYPTYDFACPIVDSIEGITHVFRSTEFADRDEQYNIIIDMLKIRKPLLFSYGKVKFIGSVMSKRKIKALIDKGKLNGWDDPRLLTIRGILNRGIHIDPLIEFVAKIGFSKNNSDMTEDKLWVMNKKFIDKIATRYTVIPKQNARKFTISNFNEHAETKDIPKFIKNLELGTRPLHFNNEIILDNDESSLFGGYEEITLMNWGNAIVSETPQTSNLTLHLDGDFKTTQKKVLWISSQKTINVIITNYKGIDDEPTTKEYIGEEPMRNIKKGDYIQLMKMSYYMCTASSDQTIQLIELK